MSRKYLEHCVEELAAEVKVTPSGAKSLAHVVAVVPTAQSGRRLRLALARKYGAIVPPEIKLPDQLVIDTADPTLASRAEELLAFHAARGEADADFSIAAQLSDLRRILFEKQLEFADVAKFVKNGVLGEAESIPLQNKEGASSGSGGRDSSAPMFADVELARWRELAELEQKYYAELEKFGKRDRILVAKNEVEKRGGGGRRIFRFDQEFLNPQLLTSHCSLLTSSIVHCATAADEAERIAEYFAAVKPDEALPALCVADPEMFAELKSAFEAKGMKIHDPSRTKLSASSLGHLVQQISELVRTQSYQVFSSFVRGGDVRRWLCEECGLTDEDMTAVLVDLDNRQQELLPDKIDDIAPKTEKKLRRVFEFVKVQLRKKGVRGMLESIFRNRILDERDESAREFAAAAECVNEILSAVERSGKDSASPAGKATTGDAESLSLRHALFARLLDEAEYSLEPDEGEVILTDGWLELPFLEADELVIAGFREGCVPESVVGHPFLPDSLRTKLGLTDNAAREKRDRAIFALACGRSGRDSASPVGMMRVYFHTLDAKGDVLKPSRLLFETDDDAELIRRVKSFYGTQAGTALSSAADLPRNWKLKLPIPPEHEELVKISPTRLDGYLRCPFTYFLRRKDILGDKRLDDRAEELASWEYGNLAHEALEAWGLSELKDSEDADAIYEFLERRVDAQLVERFGTAIPAIVAMQGESVKRRLRHFSAVQAAHRREGWRIAAVEKKLEIVYDHTRFHGKCDRIDRNDLTGEWRVIDYKTWDSADKAAAFTKKKDGTVEWNSLQLPIYCAMLDVDAEAEFAEAKLEKISSCYCVLGKTADDVKFTEPFQGGMVSSAEAKIRELIPLIEKGIFWPPGKSGEWKWDYEDWIGPDPAETIDEEWIGDQNMRLESSLG